MSFGIYQFKSAQLKPIQLIICLILCLNLLACGGSSDSSDNVADADSSPDSGTDVGTDTGATGVALKINEIVASATNDGDDWIELYALADIADLSTYTLVDDNTEREAQSLPAGSLSAGEFLLVYAIDEDDTPPADNAYVTFKLGSDDAVNLYLNGELVDTLDWEEGEAQQGYSYGLFTDGSGDAQTLTPTPNAINQESSETVVVYDNIINNDAVLRINEVVAKGIDGGNDWIELYASGNEAVFLGDYTLADQNTDEAFALPDVSIAPGEFYRVFATSDALEGESTVDFKLGSADQVNLYLGTDLIDSFEWDKGQALIKASFGRFPDGSDSIQTLDPTPLSSNVAASRGALVINEVVASQTDESSDWFELYNNSNTEILLSDYQVIDSSDDIDPVALPEVYLAPNQYIVIFAVDEDPGTYYVPFKLGSEDELSLINDDETVDYIEWQASDVSAGYSYGLTSDGAWSHNTLALTQGAANQLVEVYARDTVESIYFEIDPDQWQDLLDNALDEEYHPTSVSYKGVTLDEVAIRTKGNSSLRSVYTSSSDRYSFNIDVNEYVDGQKLLGMKKFVLNNIFNDPSYMREYIAYDLLEEMGVATPQHSYVNVYVNNELKGLYLLVEFVNGEFIEQHFANEEGDLYKPDGVGSDLKYINDDIASYSDINLKTNEETSDNGAFMNFVSEMAFGDGLDVIDVDSVLRYMSVSVALSNLDSYHGALAHNYYIYEQDNVFSLLPWDLNEAFGSFSRGCERNDIRELYIDEPTDGAMSDKPLINLVFSDPQNLITYHGYLNQLISGPLQSNAFAQRVAQIDALISEHVNNDPSAFYSFSQYQTNQNSTVSGFYGLTSFIEYRVANMTQQLNGELPASGNGSGFCN